MANNKSDKNKTQSLNKNSIGFSSKGNRKESEPKVPVKEPKEKLTKKQIIILVAVTLAAVIVAGIIIGTVIIIKKTNNPNYLKSDLSKYISISEEDYKNYVIDIPLDTPTDLHVTNRINTLLTEHKKLNEEYNGGYVKSEAVGVGDIVYIYYRGYTVGEDGREVDFDGSSNFSGDHAELEVGTGKLYQDGKAAGSFILGFGESLVGIVPLDHAQFERIGDGTVAEGDVVYLSYTVIGGESVESKSGVTYERIDLSLPYIDEIYGTGFKDFLLGKKIGESLGSFLCTVGNDKTQTNYSDMKVEFVTRCESDPVTIDVRFPANYSATELRGVDAKFDVYVKYAKIYDTPTFDDTFITETLKESADTLKDYKGETLTEKYKSKLTLEVEKDIEESNHELLEDAMWEHLLKKVEVKKLPKVPVETYYNAYYNQIASEYQQYYTESYADLDSYAKAKYGVSADKSWTDFITEEAEASVIEKLVFYYIIREENLLPPEAEYNRIYEEIYNEHLNYYLDLHEEEFSKLEGEEYEKELEVLKGEIDSYYGEEYFRESVYYYYCTRKMVEFASLTR